ncbi:MAG: hypothetical protein RIG63_15380 [Coleofasciculus chthonoplastes F3-SA18-01]|jgi:predicted nucleic acid-binding protein|uniref:hypothetical protein n=1 Tax=Coleofasciculus chthonoplastes TaxID=64178 RepID=UPI0032FB3D97
MMNGVDNAIFLDTKILVYASISESPLHLIAFTAIQTLEQGGSELWISRFAINQ